MDGPRSDHFHVGTSIPGPRRAPELVSVIVPARDAIATIAEQLAALAEQDYRESWEVVVADNGSRDGTPDLVRTWSGRLPGLRIVDAARHRGASYARNVGTAAAGGEFLAFCDADDVVTPGWLTALVRAAPSSDMVVGPLDLDALNDADVRAWMGWKPPTDGLPVELGFLPGAFGGSCGIWRDALEQVGGWNVEYPRLNDVELAWRLQLASFRLGFAPAAVVHCRLRSDLRALWTRNYHIGQTWAQLFREFHARGMPRTDTKRAVRAWAGLVRHAPEVVRSRARRGAYVRVLARKTGQVTGSIRQRTVYL